MAPDKPLTPADLRERALGYMGKGDYDHAIEDWKSLVQAEPTADNWNDLSYAYLQARRYTEAAEAGKSALKLQESHPYASYNTGMAYLENGEPGPAALYLESSQRRQPDRYEPRIALARAFQSMGSYALATYWADQAAKIKGNAPEVKAVLAALAETAKAAPPPDLTTASVAKLQDGDTSLYLYPEKTPGQSKNSNRQYSLYVVFAGGKSQKLPLGYLRPASETIRKAALPGGFTGYWIDVYIESIAYVAHSDGWVLAAVKDQTAHQVLFPAHSGREGDLQDTLDSGEMPTVQGDRIFASHWDGASGSVFYTYELQLSPDLSLAVAVGDTGEFDGKILAVDGTAITFDPVRSVNGQYKWTLKITDATQITQGSQPATKAALAVGARGHVTFKDDTVLKLQLGK